MHMEKSKVTLIMHIHDYMRINTKHLMPDETTTVQRISTQDRFLTYVRMYHLRQITYVPLWDYQYSSLWSFKKQILFIISPTYSFESCLVAVAIHTS